VSSVLQRLLLSLWRDRAVGAAIEAAAVDYRRRRLGLCDALSGRGLQAHGMTGINVWVAVPDETRAVGSLRDAGYVVAPGSLFRTSSGQGIRITVSPLDDDAIVPLADAVAAAVQSPRSGAPSR
jgi:aspartate/methionine/tyrosine aminotransferase